VTRNIKIDRNRWRRRERESRRIIQLVFLSLLKAGKMKGKKLKKKKIEKKNYIKIE